MPLRLFVALVVFASLLSSAQDTAPERKVVQVSELAIPYRLLAPRDLEPGHRYPLVLFLHGAGERGRDNELQLAHFPERMEQADSRSRFPAFVLAPQCPEERRWVEVDWTSPTSTPFPEEPSLPMRGAIAALQEVAREYPVDPQRIYLTGLSMGGFGAWDLATRHPEWFAAVVPVCGGGDETTAFRLAGLPLAVWHGVEDRTVPVERSRGMVQVLRRQGQEVQYAEPEGVGHDVWNQAYGEGGCLPWMFQQQRDLGRLVEARASRLSSVLAEDERVAFLGDSITQAGAADGGYVDLLRRTLSKGHPGRVVIPAGVGGHRVPDLIGRYQQDVIDKDASLVFVYIGINDVWHSEFDAGTPIEQYERQLKELVGGLLASGARVVLATPSVIGEKSSGKNRLDEMLDDYSECSRRVAREYDIVLCDLRRAFLDYLDLHRDEGEVSGVLTSDGVHLNEQGNLLVALEAAEALWLAARGGR